MGLVPSHKEKIREEIDKIKSLKGKELREYLWEYYKVVIIGFLTVLLLVGGGIYNAIVNPTPTTVLNVAWSYGPQLMDFFADLRDELTTSLTEPSQNEVVDVFSFAITGDPQMDVGNQMRFVAMMTARELDVVVATREWIESSVADGMIMDISSWLPSGTEGLLRLECAVSRSPVFGVSIQGSSVLENVDFFTTDESPTPYVAVFINTGREELARKVLELLLERA